MLTPTPLHAMRTSDQGVYAAGSQSHTAPYDNWMMGLFMQALIAILPGFASSSESVGITRAACRPRTLPRQFRDTPRTGNSLVGQGLQTRCNED